MGELVKQEAMLALSDQQRAFVDAILSGASNEEAARNAGYAQSTFPAHILRSQAVTAALDAWCDAALNGELRFKALKKLEKLLDEGPAATQFNAAKLILETQRTDDKRDDRPLSERSTADLAAMIDRLEAERTGRMKDVTPANGA